MLIFERSRPGRTSPAQIPAAQAAVADIPEKFLRKKPPLLPEASEMDLDGCAPRRDGT